MKKEVTSRNPFVRFLFVVYVAVMLLLLFCRPSDWDSTRPYRQLLQENINLQPFYTLRNYWYVIRHSSDSDLIRHCVINLGGNILLFIPAGFLIPRIWQSFHNFFRFFTVCFGGIFAVEVIQLFTLRGSFDVDDLILNLLGMTVGFLIFHIANTIKRKK